MEPSILTITITPSADLETWSIHTQREGIFTDEAQVARGRTNITRIDLWGEVVDALAEHHEHERACARLTFPT